mmetsp:Transcript_4944/g.7736  ORF Transcript_4944/g.7736 Transcript_4944/m.7736 type:complete len:688 (-) Transcript_4944:995-3058(-)
MAYSDGGSCKIQVLVCTANLGNTCPDRESIAALIPEDGCTSEVCDSSKYPLPTMDEERALRKEMGFHDDSGKCLNHGDPQKYTSANKDYFDIIVCGFQEATFTEHNEQFTSGSKSVSNPQRGSVIHSVKKDIHTAKNFYKTKDHLNPKQANITETHRRSTSDSNVIGNLLRSRCPSYNFSVRYQRGAMRLEILVREGLEVETISVRAQNTGVMYAANKGGIIAELLVEKFTRLTFCSAHLQAHEGEDNYQQRCRMASAILQGTASEESPLHLDLSVTSHLTFFLGDLNFRTDLKSERKLTKEEHIERVHRLVETKNWRELNKADELFKALKQNDCLIGFKTLPCLFPPTYKVERQRKLSYSKQRRPSYTDRIVWKVMHDMGYSVRPLAYEPVIDFSTSDHKPLRGAFEITLNKAIELRRSSNRVMDRRMQLYRQLRYPTGGPTNASLHLFISNLECRIEKRGNPPDPFIVFLSNPLELIRLKSNRWQAFTNNIRGIASRKRILLHGTGFPRTKAMRSTNHPQWAGETHLAIKMEENGKPLDLSGAILFLVVMDRTANNIIGTFPLNLANLAIAREVAINQIGGTQSSRWKNLMLNLRPAAPASHRRSNTLVTSNFGDASWHFKQHLTKNGEHMDWISFSLCCKWLADSAAHGEVTKLRLTKIGKKKNQSELALLPRVPSMKLFTANA